MKPFILGILLSFVAVVTLAQDPYDTFARAFGENYSTQNFGAIHDLTSDSFKKQITKEQIVQVLTEAYAHGGKLLEIKLSEANEQGRIFHVVCERATFALSVNLDASGKAAGLLIRPVEHPGAGNDAQSIIAKWKSNDANAGLVIGIIRDGKSDIQYLGVANKKTSATIEATSIFEIGSISKPITGILLHILIGEGKISLDDPVNKFLPGDSHLPKVKDKDILIRHLITHSACLPRMPGNFNPPSSELNNPYHYYGEKDLLAFLPQVTTGDCELNTSPVYSNLGAGLLGYILAKVSGQTYADLVKEKIAKPLKTKNFGVIGASDKWVQGHTPSGAAQPQWTFTEALVGAGGIDASVEDMVKLLLFLMKPDQSPLGKAVVDSKAEQLRGPQGAMGTFWILQPKGSSLVLWHNGQTGGFNAFIAWIEGTQTGVFILSNNGEDIATGLGVAIIGAEK